MTTFICTVTLEYNGFYIGGSHKVSVPTPDEGKPFGVSEDCIHVGCRMWQDAEVTIEVGPPSGFSTPETAPRFEAVIRTPKRKLILFDANHPELIPYDVATRRTPVRIWTNHASEPDHVIVMVGE